MTRQPGRDRPSRWGAAPHPTRTAAAWARGPRAAIWWAAAAIALAAGVAYSNSLRGPLVFDDLGSIADNPTIRDLSRIGEVLSPPRNETVGGRPLLNLSFAVNHAVGGAGVLGYHLVNLAIHVLAGWTLLGLARRTLLRPGLRQRFGEAATSMGFAVALLWTVLPLQTDSVTYVVQRQGRLEEARAHFAAALRIRPNHPDAARNLARIDGEEGRLP